MSATSYGRRKIVDDLTGVAPYAPPPLYLSLHTGDPGVAGSHAYEVSGGGYSRRPLAGVMSVADADGISVNTAVINFGPASADWGNIIYLAIEDAVTGGNMVCPGMPATPRTVTSGQPMQIPVGRLRLRLT
jgi:hypothetical protein